MGEVYRAKDTRLDRDVALKILPAAFSNDADRLARFEREAKAIAALSHPNILAVFETGTYDGHVAVVTELLTGQTLRDVLAAGALPVRKTVEYGIQIARGLAAAHDRGLVHRDLKPENIFVLGDGQIKILDFGLARTLDAEGNDQTRTRALTDPGMVVGTVGYMAPEQVRGQAIDTRADLFSLGAVIYEMLSGTRAFRRDTAAETMTAILKDDPPELSGSRPEISPALDRIIRHCLEKNPQERFQTARDVAFALGAMSGSDVRTASGAPAVSAGRFAGLTGERLAWCALSIALASVAVWLYISQPHAAPVDLPVTRTTVLLPEGVSLVGGVASRRFAVSPDGRHLAYVGTTSRNGETLYLQALSELEGHRIEGADAAFSPFWSPDSQSVGFRSRDRIMRADPNGGRMTQIATSRGTGIWGLDDKIVLSETAAAGSVTASLQVLSLSGGPLTDAFPPATGTYDGFYTPRFASDGRTLIFGYLNMKGSAESGIFASRLGSGERTLITRTVAGEMGPFFVASGYLLRARDRMVVAQPFDLEHLRVTGPVTEVAGPIDASLLGGAGFAVSSNGVLVYQPAFSKDGATRIQVFDRSGVSLGTLGDDADYSNLELSPDGKTIVFSVDDVALHTRDIWLMDVTRGIRSRFTFDPSDERSASWSADGKALIYTSKGLDLYRKPLGSGAEQPFIVDGVRKDPRGVVTGEYFVYRANGQGTGNDLWVKMRDEAPKPFLASPFNENYAAVSPDGKWMAYSSDEAGQFEVYVTSFPSGEGKWRITTGGASLPRWRHDGRELYFLSGDSGLYAVSINATAPATFNIGTPQKLFQTSAVTSPGSSFDVSPDGRRFYVNSQIPSGAPPALVVVTNWPALIKKKP